jgi:hypothetical protein
LDCFSFFLFNNMSILFIKLFKFFIIFAKIINRFEFGGKKIDAKFFLLIF